MKNKRLRHSRIPLLSLSRRDEPISTVKPLRTKHVSSEIKQIQPENLQDPSSVRIHSQKGTHTTVDSRPVVQRKRKNRAEFGLESASRDGDVGSPSRFITDSPQKDEMRISDSMFVESHQGVPRSGFLESTEEKNNLLFQSPLDTEYSKPREFVSISVMVKSVEPISAHMEVNVSLPTTMWCEGVLRGSQIHPGNVRSSREGLLVTSRNGGDGKRKILPSFWFPGWSQTLITTSTVLVLLSMERLHSRCSAQ